MSIKIILVTPVVVVATFLGVLSMIMGLTNSSSVAFSESSINSTTIGASMAISDLLPLTLSGTIHHFTNNNTQPAGVWVIVGTWSLNIQNSGNAIFVSDVVQARAGNIPYEQREETSTHITNLRTESITLNNARIEVNGTADNVQNGSMRFKDIPVSVVILGGDTVPYSQIYVTQGGEAGKVAIGATPWYGTVDQKNTKIEHE